MSENPQATAPPSSAPTGEVHAFQAEMQQLLHIIVHSLYSEREIFLRELISNASDALNKVKFETLTRQDLRDKDAPLEITLELDGAAHAITVSDTGIGMAQEELAQNLGTIARSGTLEFVKSLAQQDPKQRSEMIGQFGVGFYSVFMVARQVVVDSCPADPAQKAARWTSTGDGHFTLGPSPRKQRGTSVRVELKPEAEEFARVPRVEEIVKRYSNFVPHPILLQRRRLNAQDAIWGLPKAQVSEEQYREFHQFLTGDPRPPLHALHLAIDAPVQYKALLFVPEQLSNEVLYSPGGPGLHLYASRVMIQEDSQELLPVYLRFLRGVVDSEDLPLNVSREMVQRNPLLARLRTSLAGRVLRELKALADSHAERYRALWAQYGKVLKEGISADPPNRERLLELARFNSSLGKSADDLTTLKDYVSRMREGQQEILYLTGPSREAVERNPNLEFFRQHGLEVLYLVDRGVDDFMMASLQEFEGKRFASIDSASLDVFKLDAFKPDVSATGASTAGAQAGALGAAELEPLLAYLKQTYGDRVSQVQASQRLVESPATLVTSGQVPGNFQKVLRMLDKEFKIEPKILEVNPAHPLIRSMAGLVKQEHPRLLNELAEQLLDNCLIVEGLLEHPERMIGRIQSLMTRAAEAATESTAAPETPGAKAVN